MSYWVQYNTQTGEAQHPDALLLRQTAGWARGVAEAPVPGLPEPRLPHVTLPANHAGVAVKLITKPHPTFAGTWVVNRNAAEDGWHFRSLAGREDFHWTGGSGQGLAASAVWDGVGVSVVDGDRVFRFLTALSEPDWSPQSFHLGAPACPNAAPLLTAQSKTSAHPYEVRSLFVATTAGLVHICLNELEQGTGASRGELCGPWSGDPALFWSPVLLRGKSESAVITFHAEGTAHITRLDEVLRPCGHSSVSLLKPGEAFLRPPAVTRHGLWCIATTPRTVGISVYPEPAALQSPRPWRKAVRLLPCFGSTAPSEAAWTPVVLAGHGGGSRAGAWLFLLGRECYAALDEAHIEQAAPQRYASREAVQVHPALTACDGRRILVNQVGTSRNWLFEGGKWRECAPLSFEAGLLAGGPAMLGERVIWPTLYGLAATDAL